MTVDLDSARAARREASGVAPVVVFHGTSYELPVELPWDVLEALSDAEAAAAKNDTPLIADATRRAVAGLLGDATTEFMAEHPSQDDIMALLTGIQGEYGTPPLGEASASSV